MVSLEKPPSEDENSVAQWIRNRKIDLVINIPPEGTSRKDEVTAGYLMRRLAVDFGASLLTNQK
jgi:carbamoyl-phosphate synthase large subunit